MATDLHCDVLPAEGIHSASLIFLHGLGDRGENCLPTFKTTRIPYVKYIFPTAPTIAVTWQKGAEMPAWFDIGSLSFQQYDANERGIRNSVKTVHAMIEEEIKSGIPSNRIFVAGFSQGGGLALHSGLVFDKPLAGLIGLSARLPLPRRITAERRVNFNVPILHCYGDSDGLLPMDIVQRAATTIRQFNKNNYTLNVYPKLAHTTSEQEMKDVKEFICKHAPEK